MPGIQRGARDVQDCDPSQRVSAAPARCRVGPAPGQRAAVRLIADEDHPSQDDLPYAARLSPHFSAMKRRLAIAAVLALAVGIALTSWLRVSEASARARIVALAEQLEEWREAADFDREAAWGDTVEGAAWPHYERALEAVEAEPDSLRDRIAEAAAFTGEQDAAARAERSELLERCQEVLSEVHAGAHARDARIGDPGEGFGADAAKLVSTRALSDLAILFLCDAEGPEAQLDAVRAALDIQQFGRDLASSPLLINEMIGLVIIVPYGLDEWLRGGLAKELDTAAKREWLAGLERLERSLAPESVAVRGELELCASGILTGLEPDSGSVMDLLQWPIEDVASVARLHHHAAAFIEAFHGLVPTIEAHYRTPGREGYDALTSIGDELVEGGNPIAELCAPLFAPALLSRHTGRTRLSFLRHALALHLGVESAPPLDLFGSGVEVEELDGRVRISTTDFLGRVIEIEL